MNMGFHPADEAVEEGQYLIVVMDAPANTGSEQ
jgi:hypothetical protein